MKKRLLILLVLALVAGLGAFRGLGERGHEAKADTPHAGLDFSMGIDVDGDGVDECSTKPRGPVKCSAPVGATVTAHVYLNNLGGVANYEGFTVQLTYTNVTSKNNADPKAGRACTSQQTTQYAAGSVRFRCLGSASTYTGLIGTNDFNCDPSGTIVLNHANTALFETLGLPHQESGTETLNINCEDPAPPPDNFKCYGARLAPGTARFQRRTVALTDQFGTKDARVLGLTSYCNPVSQDGLIALPSRHLTCYSITQSTFDPFDVQVVNKLSPNGQDLTVRSAESVCVSAAKKGKGTAFTTRYKCYRARTKEGDPAFEPQVVALDDPQFSQEKRATVLRPVALCNPLTGFAQAGEAAGVVQDPPEFFVCYQLRQALFPPFNIDVNDFFGNKQGVQWKVTILRADRLCVLSKKEAAGTVPDNDDFSNATSIPGLPVTDHVITTAATTETLDPTISCKPNDGYGHSVWYKYTTGGSPQIVWVNTFGSSYDTVLAAFDSTLNELTNGCDDDVSPVVLQSQITVALAASTTYYFLVGSWDDTEAGKLILTACADPC